MEKCSTVTCLCKSYKILVSGSCVLEDVRNNLPARSEPGMFPSHLTCQAHKSVAVRHAFINTRWLCYSKTALSLLLLVHQRCGNPSVFRLAPLGCFVCGCEETSNALALTPDSLYITLKMNSEEHHSSIQSCTCVGWNFFTCDMACLRRGHRTRVGISPASVRLGMVSGYAACEYENKMHFCFDISGSCWTAEFQEYACLNY